MSRGFKFTSALKELRLHLCQKGESSRGARDFIEHHYVDLKSCNSKFPILIRECSGIQPSLWARMEKGKELHFNLSGLSAADILSKIESIAKC